jgi:hypothetical protein
MSTVPESTDLFHLVGVGVAASQVFEVIFVIAAKLVLKQPDVQVLEDIEPISQSKSFKQPVTALLRELSKAQAIEPELEGRVTRLIENRHRMIHRLFLEFGWPAAIPREKEGDFVQLCARVASESQAISIVFVDLVLNWMKRFPAMSETALAHEHKFAELAARIRAQSSQMCAV